MVWVEDIRGWLATAGLGLTAGTNLFVSQMPPSPNECVALFDYGGTPPQFFLGGSLFDRPSLQVAVRAETLTRARSLMDSIFDKLLTVNSVSIGGKVWVSTSPVQTPFFLRKDELERPWVVCNFDITKEH